MEKLLPNKGTYVIITRSYGFLAKIIRFGMRVDMFLRNKKGVTVNHADLLIDGMVSGAVATGVENRTVNSSYLSDGKRKDLYVFKVRINKNKKEELRDFCLDSDKKKYEYLNFLWHTIEILRHKWLGKRGKAAEKRVYCIEYVAMGLNKVFPGLVEQPWRINPTDLYDLCMDKFQLVEIVNVPKYKK